MENGHLEAYKVMLLDTRRKAKDKLDEIYREQMRRANESAEKSRD